MPKPDIVTLIIPKWFYPNNLGDSIHSTFLPKAIKHKYPQSKLHIITYGELIPVFEADPLVDEVSLPNNGMAQLPPQQWQKLAFEKQPIMGSTFIVYPEWHPRLWAYWNDNFDKFEKHPTVNLLTVNSLLQIGMEDLVDVTSLDLSPSIHCEAATPKDKTIGIVPATKLAGRPTPHPGCDGKGFRFNGDNGESWIALCNTIKDLDPDIHIIEFSEQNYGFGDEHVGKLSFLDLAYKAQDCIFAIASDGGMHHLFHSVNVPVFLLGAQRINKPHFFRTANNIVLDNHWDACTKRCSDKIRHLAGWPDLIETCDGSCEKVDPVAYAKDVLREGFTVDPK